jgi:hypothetical protein
LTKSLVLKEDSAQSRKENPKVGHMNSFHAANGGADFLGWRKTAAGVTEIVYDDGVARRIVWRVAGDVASEARLTAALRRAAGSLRVLPTLYDELKKRAIAIERITG